MSSNYKPGGGNKPQPYIPAGNGKKSGEYTTKDVTKQSKLIRHCRIKNIKLRYNFKSSSLVKKVENCYAYHSSVSVPTKHKPNTVVKRIVNGYVASERYYNENGEAYLDIDYTCHGNPNTHPEVPHVHKWVKNAEGKLHRDNWESFKWELN